MANQTVREVMTPAPETLPGHLSILEAAQRMRDESIGNVMVTSDGHLLGIVTDRDLVVRVLAEGRPPATTKLEDICSRELTTVTPADPVEVATRLMREKAIRRLPVIEKGGRPVGIVSLGDLANEKDPDSVLGKISSAPPNR